MLNKTQINTLLVLAKVVVFLAALFLDWTGHLTTGQENLCETLIFSLAGVHIASLMSGRVTSAADLIARLTRLEQTVVGTATPPETPAAKG